MATTKKLRPPLWLWVLWILLLFALAGLWFGDAGDLGIRNVGTMAVLVVAGGLGFVWFVLLSGHRGKLRAGIAGGVVLTLFAGAVCLRVEGWSGSMIPEVSWRWEEAGGFVSASGEAVAAGSEIELEPGPADFPGYFGPERDGRVRGVSLRRDWEAKPPRVLWKRSVGPGWSGFAVVAGYAFTMEQWGDEEVVTAYELASGELLWSAAHPTRFDHFLGGLGPRSTPLVHRGRVYTLGAGGRFACHDGATGEVLWEHDLLELYGVTEEEELRNILYGRSNSALAVEGMVVVPAGGDPDGRMAGLVAFDGESGELVWESPPRQVSFSSPTRATLAGIDQIVVVNEDTATGHDVGDGSILWEVDWPGKTAADACVSQPTIVSENRLLLSKGYGLGSVMLEIRQDGDALVATEIWRNRRSLRTKLTSPVIHGGHAYALSDERLQCVDLATGERVWREGKYGHGQILIAEDLLILVSEEGELAIVEATPDEPGRVLARLPVLEGKCWNTLALYGATLVLRSDVEAVAVQVGVEE